MRDDAPLNSRMRGLMEEKTNLDREVYVVYVYKL